MLVSDMSFAGHIDTNDRIDKLDKKACVSLARNRQRVMFSESEGEKVVMAIRLWPDLWKKSENTPRAKFLPVAITEIGDRHLVHILENKDFYELLNIQQRTPVTWMVSTAWKINWLWRVLTSPAGGVRLVLKLFGVNCPLTPYI